MVETIKEKIHTYIDAVVGNGIYDLLKSIVMLLLSGTLSSTVTSIVIDVLNISIISKYKIHIIIVITLLIVFLVLEYYGKKFKRRPTTPDVKGNYEILKKEVTFTYGKDLSKYELDLSVKSTIKGLNRLEGKYTWSGSEPATIRCETSHCRIIPLTRKDSYIEYEVELRKSYRKGAKIDCKIVGEMPDSKHTFVPFFSTQVMKETKELVINICIPPIYGVKEIICEEIAIVRNENQDARIESLDAEGRYKWIIPHPKLFYKYSVRWEL